MAVVERHILCTATLPDTLVAHAAAQGLRIRVLPFIRTEPAISLATRDAITHHGSAHTHVVFTSVHAVEAVRTLLPIRRVPNWTAHVVGERTRSAVRTLMPTMATGCTEAYADNLAQALIADGTIRRILFCCGDQRLDTLPDTLRQADIAVEEVVVYHTFATPHHLTDTPDAVLFLSPSAVESFFQLNILHPDTVPFAIGRTTGRALQQHTDQRILQPPTPSRTALIDAVCAHFISAPTGP